MRPVPGLPSWRGATGGWYSRRDPGAADPSDPARGGHADHGHRERSTARAGAGAPGPADWTVATDCTRWSVRDVVVHLIASAQAQADQFFRQVWAGRRVDGQVPRAHWVDGVNEAQLRARRAWTADQLPQKWESAAAAALAVRRRLRALIRALPCCRSDRRSARTWGGSRWHTCSTSVAPVTCGCIGSTSLAPSAVRWTSPSSTTVGSWPTSWPNGRGCTTTRSRST